MRNLAATIIGAYFLSILTGCFAPQQSVHLQFFDADTKLPLRQVEVTQQNESRSSVLPDVPVYGYAGRKSGPQQTTNRVVDEQLRTTLPGNSQLLLAKEGYQPLRIEPKMYGLRIENLDTGQVQEDFLLEPTTLINFAKVQQTADTAENSVEKSK